jgi:hypothetical protein
MAAPDGPVTNVFFAGHVKFGTLVSVAPWGEKS